MAAPTSNSEKQLAWEARHRTRAGIASIVGAVGLFIYFALQQIISRDAPTAASGLDTFARVGRDGPIDKLPSLAIPYFEYIHDKTPLFIVMGITAALGFIGLAWSAGFLAVATRARAPGFKRWQLYLPIIGGVVLGLSLLLLYIVADDPGQQLPRRPADGPHRAGRRGRRVRLRAPARLPRRAACWPSG